MMSEEYPDSVVVDENDTVIGQAQMPQAYADGKILRVSIVLIANLNGELLLQKRGPAVLSPNLWTVSASGHVDAGESYKTTAERELAEEVGIEGVELNQIDYYFTHDSGKGWSAKRFNSVYAGVYSGRVTLPDLNEVSDYKWMSIPAIRKTIEMEPEQFSPGFKRPFNSFVENTT